MYSYKNDNAKSDRTAEGIKNCHKEDYKNVLTNKQMHHKMKTIGSNNHQLTSYELNKLSLSCFDDKRYIHLDSITSSTLLDVFFFVFEANGQAPVRVVQCLPINRPSPTLG